MNLRHLLPSDLPLLARHRIRHSNENGRDGDFIFAPSEEPRIIKDEDFKLELMNLLKPVTEPGWLKGWIVTDEKEVFGNITLVNRPPMKSALHRCLLMMGIERSLRGQGWGSKLMVEALDWAKQQPALDWVTLNVFENNPPAKALYKKFGFEVVGTTHDMFRVFDKSIDSTEMVLKLR